MNSSRSARKRRCCSQNARKKREKQIMRDRGRRQRLMDYQRYKISVVVPQDIAAQSIEMSQALRQFGSVFVLDGETTHPHLSLYHVPFDEAALAVAITAVGEIAAATISPTAVIA